FFFSSRRRHTRFSRDWSSDVCSSDLITYSFYPVYAGLYEIAYRSVPLAADFSIRVEDYKTPNGGIIFPNPNAPTGMLLPLAAIEIGRASCRERRASSD